MRKLHVNKIMTSNQTSTGSGNNGGGAAVRGPSAAAGQCGGAGGTPQKSCKKVLPPAIPLEFLQRRNSQNLVRRNDDETPTNVSLMPPDPQKIVDGGGGAITMEDSALNFYSSDGSDSIPEHNVLLLNHRQAVYYHQQLAIDPSQVALMGKLGNCSPPPPPPPCRNSTASVDSGRGNSMLFVNGPGIVLNAGASSSSSVSSPAPSSGSSSSISTSSSNNNNNNSKNTKNPGLGVVQNCYCGGQGGLTGGCCCSLSSNSSTSSKLILAGIQSVGGAPLPGTAGNRCSSISSCSLGSVDRISTSTSLKAAEEAELIADWLYEINCPDYYLGLFLAAGYDLPTIARMTFEDLTAIGIRTPNEREFLISHIKQLHPPDNLPHYVPNSIREFLRILNMEEYSEKLAEQNFQNVRDICKLIWDDLEDIGIVKLGHQKKILLAIKRIKDILNGKFVATPTQNQLGGGMGGVSGGQMSGPKNGSIGYFSISSQGSTTSVSPSPPINNGATPTPIFNFNPADEAFYHQQIHPCACDKESNILCALCAAALNPQYETNEIVPIQVRHRQQMVPELQHPDQMGPTAPPGHGGMVQLMNAGNIPDAMSSINSAKFEAHQQQQQHSLNSQHSWTAGGQNPLMHRKSFDDVDLALSKQQHHGYFRPSNQQQQQQSVVEEASYYYSRMHSMGGGSSGGGGGTLPRNFGGISLANKDEKVRPVAKVQAQVVMRQTTTTTATPPPPSITASVAPPFKETGQFVGQQPVYVNFGHLNNHVHHHFYGVQPPPQQNPSAMLLVNTQAEVHHHAAHDLPPPPATAQHHLQQHHPNDLKSNTSLDSIDQIPFANENAGTIKQRGGGGVTPTYYHHHHNMNVPHVGHQRTSSGGGDSSAGSDELAELERLESLRIEDDDEDVDVNGGSGGGGIVIPPPDINANVLNDIGNMLANLTDELDAMLEEEKRAGLNDD